MCVYIYIYIYIYVYIYVSHSHKQLIFVEIKIFLSLIHGRKKNSHIIISMKKNNQEKEALLCI